MAPQVGMRQGDQVLEVDGAHVMDMTPFQAASLIAGQTPLESAGPTDTVPKDYVELKVCDGTCPAVGWPVRARAGDWLLCSVDPWFQGIAGLLDST
jgi:hypothetical protein